MSNQRERGRGVYLAVYGNLRTEPLRGAAIRPAVCRTRSNDFSGGSARRRRRTWWTSKTNILRHADEYWTRRYPDCCDVKLTSANAFEDG